MVVIAIAYLAETLSVLRTQFPWKCCFGCFMPLNGRAQQLNANRAQALKGANFLRKTQSKLEKLHRHD